MKRYLMVSTVNNCYRALSSWSHVKEVSKRIDLAGSNSPIDVSTGRVARLADGSAEVRIGNTSVLSVVVWKRVEDGSVAPFLPLTVSYRQQMASLGRIPKSFDRRDRFTSTTEILTGRLIDRCIRAGFKDSSIVEALDVTCSVLCDDLVHDPDIVAINASSVALGLSTLPGYKAVGAVRVAVDSRGNLILNPSKSQRFQSDVDLVVAADVNGHITALESGCNKVPRGLFIEALKQGTSSAQTLAHEIHEFTLQNSKPKYQSSSQKSQLSYTEEILSLCEERLLDVFRDARHDKLSRDLSIKSVRLETAEKLRNKLDDREFIPEIFESCFTEAIGITLRKLAINENTRCDGRRLDDLRPIDCKSGIYPALHGSALFSRGQTQVLCRLAFDSLTTSEQLDPISASLRGKLRKYFMLHYQFPAYSTNTVSTGKVNANRRELGHGNLAEMGIAPLVPVDYKFTIRLLAEVLESNGSSSMASVCAASLALMDAGVPIDQHAAGVAIGLLSNRSKDENSSIEDCRLLTDILGFEDFFGEMDFKICGTKSGQVTALQCDVKKHGIPLNVAIEAVDKGLQAIAKIIQIMESDLQTPRDVAKASKMPQVRDFEIHKYKMAGVFGPGRLNVKHLEDVGCVFSTKDESTLSVFAPNQSLMKEVVRVVEDKLNELKEPMLQFGQICNAKIESIVDKGIYVTIYQDQKPVFIPNFQLDAKNVSHASVLGFAEGQNVKVKFFGRDPSSGRMRLSRRALLIPASELPSMDYVS